MKYLSLLFLGFYTTFLTAQSVTIVRDANAPRIKFGAERISKTLKEKGYEVTFLDKTPKKSKNNVIVIGAMGTDNWKQNTKKFTLDESKLTKKEGFQISTQKNIIFIEGFDDSGALYGALELADRIKEDAKLPSEINKSDSPEMVLRGTCIGVQKPVYLEGRGVYLKK